LKNDEQREVETISDEIILSAVQALSKYSLLVNQQNLFNLSLEVVDHTLK
jgi:hypothetical protein